MTMRERNLNCHQWKRILKGFFKNALRKNTFTQTRGGRMSREPVTVFIWKPEMGTHLLSAQDQVEEKQ